jgi:predicted PurR-regulated permease PerM
MPVPKKIFISDDNPVLKSLQLIVYGAAILYVGQELFIPLSYALLISFVLYPVCHWLEKKNMGRLTSILAGLLLLLIVFLLILTLLTTQLISFLGEWPILKTKIYQSLGDLSLYLTQAFDLSRAEQQGILQKFTKGVEGNLITFIQSTLTTSAYSIVMLVLIPVYVVLILYYRKQWLKVLVQIFPGESKEGIREVLSLTIRTYYNFIKGMAIVYLVVGILNSVGLLLLGIPHAILFGFIASILTFIPYVGILIGALLPIAVAWITYDSIWYPLGIIGVFTFVQYLEANLIFPIAVSSRLNINTMATLIAIIVGGMLWGVAGMILFIPFVGIVKIIASHHRKWKALSMMLGTDAAEEKSLS